MTETKQVKKTQKKFVTISRGQTVTIDFDEAFRRAYPHTFKMFQGKAGTILQFIGRKGISMVALKIHGGIETAIGNYPVETVIDRRHIYEGRAR